LFALFNDIDYTAFIVTAVEDKDFEKDLATRSCLDEGTDKLWRKPLRT
jgi:hypothetical protein